MTAGSMEFMNEDDIRAIEDDLLKRLRAQVEALPSAQIAAGVWNCEPPHDVEWDGPAVFLADVLALLGVTREEFDAAKGPGRTDEDGKDVLYRRLQEADALRDEIFRVVGECAGAVSMCWEPRPTGVFDSTQAATYVEGAVARLTSVQEAEEKRARADERLDVGTRANAALRAKDERIVDLLEALAFYADPSTYHASAISPDPPCGEFWEDFSEDHGDAFYNRPMPGKRARDAIGGEAHE